MKAKPSAAMFVGLTLASLLLGLLAFFFAGVPMLIMRKQYGLKAYLMMHMTLGCGLCALGLAPFGLLYVALALLIAVFCEMRLRLKVALAGLVALVSGLSFSAVAGLIYLKLRGIDEYALFKAHFIDFVQNLTSVSPQMRVDAEVLWGRLPAILVMTFIAALTIAAIVETKLGRWFQHDSSEEAIPEKLSHFRVPDAFVWVAIASFMAAFLEVGQPLLRVVGLNVFYIMIFFYFLQGLAIAATYFETFKVDTLWRSIWYVLMIVQLSVVVAVIGFSDYWVDYREKITRKAAEMEKKI